MTALALAPAQPALDVNERQRIDYWCRCGASWHGEWRPFEMAWLNEQWQRQHNAALGPHGHVQGPEGFERHQGPNGRWYRGKRAVRARRRR
jgi:hypothetical protein